MLAANYSTVKSWGALVKSSIHREAIQLLLDIYVSSIQKVELHL